MAFKTNIAAALRARGLHVVEVAGWTTRGSSSFAPQAVVCHWTAGPRNAALSSRPSLNVVTYGRTGVPGPLCNVYLARDGVAYVVAAGRANHAGTGGWRGLSGNSSVYGIEAEAAGDGDWTVQMRNAYPRVVAALLDTIGRDASWTCGHHEWTTRKIDPRDYTMDVMRRDVALVKAGQPINVSNPGPSTPPPSTNYNPNGYSADYVRDVQNLLRGVGYSVVADGVLGPITFNAIKSFQAQKKLAVDGIPGPITVNALRAAQPAPPPPPAPSGPEQLVVDGDWGPATTRRLQQVLGTHADGVISSQDVYWRDRNPGLGGGWQWVASGSARGSQAIAALQSRIGAGNDGLVGPNTFKALQRHLGTVQDGVVSRGSSMVMALQRRLNEGRI